MIHGVRNYWNVLLVPMVGPLRVVVPAVITAPVPQVMEVLLEALLEVLLEAQTMASTPSLTSARGRRSHYGLNAMAQRQEIGMVAPPAHLKRNVLPTKTVSASVSASFVGCLIRAQMATATRNAYRMVALGIRQVLITR